MRFHQQLRATWSTPQLLAFRLSHLHEIGLLRGMQLSPHHNTQQKKNKERSEKWFRDR